MSEYLLAKAKEWAEKNGGKCLSREISHNRAKVMWECSEEHVWGNRFSFGINHWCSFCSSKLVKLQKFEELQKTAKEKGGICLSESYGNGKTKLKWQCSKGHIWYMSPSAIINRNYWCPYCAGNAKLTIEKMQETAKEKGGKCLSIKYNGIHEKLQWECSEGHVWEARPNDIINNGSWCPYCCGHAKLTIEFMQKIAEERGGKCLSTEYKNVFSKLKWECENKHVWDAIPLNIVHKHGWCPHCKVKGSEEICRRYFETIFKCKFNKTRPDWLIGAKGRKLELDGMSEIKFGDKYLAFEHDGQQHYHPVEIFHGNHELLIINDNIKTKLCEENNVILFRIPELFTFTRLNDLGRLIKNIALDNGLYIETDINIDLSGIHSLESKLKKCNDIVESKGGKILSGYINSTTKMKILCNKNHIFYMIPNSIKIGYWCPYCSRNVKHTIEEMKKIASERGGECLSDIYTNVKTKLKWKCYLGHVWESAPVNIVKGCWCPECHSKTIIQRMING